MKKQPRRALTQVGGETECRGDRVFSRPLQVAMEAPTTTKGFLSIHGFHAYPARMHPSIAQVLLEQFFVGARGKVLDPFCGSGTVMIEAMRSQWQGLGSDLDPIAIALARTKTFVGNNRSFREFQNRLYLIGQASEQRVRERVHVRANLSASERQWYEPHVLKELAGLLEEIRNQSEGGQRQAFEMIFSAILLKFSKQKSDTVEEIQEKRIRKGLVTEFFVRKGEELIECWKELADHVPRPVSRPSLLMADAGQLKHKLGGEYQCDLIVTSPPYAGTYDYAHHHARRRSFLGMSAKRLMDGEIGARRDFAEANINLQRNRLESTWDRQVLTILREMSVLLRPDGIAVMLIGDGEIAGQIREADLQIEALADRSNLKFVACASQSRPHPRDALRRQRKNNSVVRDSEGMMARREHLIALQKPVVPL